MDWRAQPQKHLDPATAASAKMRRFAKERGIKMATLDMLSWSMETGEVFK